MRKNNTYINDRSLDAMSAIQHLQSLQTQSNKRSLPSTVQAINTHIECLLQAEEECLLTPQELEIYNRATD